MCIEDPMKIEGDNVPKYGYKVALKERGMSRTSPYRFRQRLPSKVWLQPNTPKRAYNIDWSKAVVNSGYLNYGRFSVFTDKKDAIDMAQRRRHNQVWMVEIKSKVAFSGSWEDNKKVMVVDKIKLVRRYRFYSPFKRFYSWLEGILIV